jgi:hypothetical protein
LAWQKPFVMDLLDEHSPAWADRKAWKTWSNGKFGQFGRKAAWKLVEPTFGDLIVERRI